jgi:hypothetical protein
MEDFKKDAKAPVSRRIRGTFLGSSGLTGKNLTPSRHPAYDGGAGATKKSSKLCVLGVFA